MSTFLRQPAKLARIAARSAAPRYFSASSVTRKDLVQDLYLSELKAYKAPPPAKDAHVGAVKTFSAPPAPQAPTSPTDLAAELTSYDAQEPSLTEAAPAKATSATDNTGTGAQAYLAFLEQDLPKAEAHH